MNPCGTFPSEFFFGSLTPLSSLAMFLATEILAPGSTFKTMGELIPLLAGLLVGTLRAQTTKLGMQDLVSPLCGVSGFAIVLSPFLLVALLIGPQSFPPPPG